MRILILTLYFSPDLAANAVIMAMLAEDLAARGHEVTVVTSVPHYDASRIWQEYRGKLVVREPREGADVRHVYLYVPQKKGSIEGRWPYYLSFHALSTAVALVAGRPQVILAPSPPLTIGLSAYLVSRLRRIPFVYNVQDIWPDALLRLGLLTRPAAIANAQRMERFVYRSAARVAVISEGFRQNLLAKGVPERKVALIPNCVDTEFIHPLPRENAWAQEQGLQGRFVVLFAGNMGYSQGLETVLDAADQLRGEPEVVFVLNGNGAARARLESEARERNLTNVQFSSFQPKARVPEVYASADVCLVPLRHGLGEASVPSKVLTIMAAGKPLIAGMESESDTGRLVETAGSGWMVEPENGEALAAAITRLRADPVRRAEMGARGRAHVQAHYARHVAADGYEALFREVIRA